jgi:nitrite reductase/ring-hydroxylating ferredoxin subunit
VHPALVHYPWAFLTGAFLFDLAGKLTGSPAAWVTGAFLAAAGIAAALVAAVPGFIDYVYTVPPNSSGKRRATRHMVVNLSAVALFAAAWVLRRHASIEPGAAVLLAEGVGTMLLGAGGYMGGVLVNRNQIGVDHRYANMGRWREQTVVREKGEGTVALPSPALEPNQMMLLRIDGRRIVLGRTEDGYVAFDDHCTHRGGSLAGGVLMCGTVQCPWHGSQFDTATGKVRSGPAERSIGAYKVESRGAGLRIHLSD